MVAQVPGKQTVPRAEVWAMRQLLLLVPDCPLTAYTDASYVHAGCCGKRAKMLQGLNGDLWDLLYQALDARRVPASVCKVKAHLGGKHAADGTIELAHLLGNAAADEAAGAAAERWRSPGPRIASASSCWASVSTVAKA